MKDPKPIKVHVKDIRAGIAGDCYRCPVAEGLQRATGDKEASVVEKEWVLYLHAWSRYTQAPWEVVEFVRAFDGLDRDDDDKPTLPRVFPEGLRPFSFQLPPQSDPEWREECYGCEQLFPPDELDDTEGYCHECLAKESAKP